MAWFGLSAHGVQFASEWPGPGQFENVEGVPWTDLLGYRRGWGVRYRGAAGRHNWFHCGIPTLELHQHGSGRLGEIQVAFQTFGTAVVNQIHVWSGSARIVTRDGLSLSGDRVANPFVELFNPELQLRGPINVCVHVNFGSNASEVLFVRAYARFVTDA